MRKILAVLFAGLMIFTGAWATPVPAPATTKPLTWLESCYGPKTLYNDGTTANWTATWADCGPPYSTSYGSPLPSSVAYYSDYNAFITDLNSGALSSYKWVLYDPEKWSNTPLAQQQSWQMYERLFCQYAHANGMECILTPAADLASAPGVNGWTAWLAENGPGLSAQWADVFDIQAQTQETNLSGQPGSYNYEVQQSAQLALAANPAVTVIAGLHGQSGGCSGTDITPAQTQAAYDASVQYVSGYWLNNDCYAQSFVPLLNGIYG